MNKDNIILIIVSIVGIVIIVSLWFGLDYWQDGYKYRITFMDGRVEEYSGKDFIIYESGSSGFGGANNYIEVRYRNEHKEISYPMTTIKEFEIFRK